MLSILRVQHTGADSKAMAALIRHFPEVQHVTVLAETTTHVAGSEEE